MTTRSDPVKVNWAIRKWTSRNLTNTLILLCVGITGVRSTKMTIRGTLPSGLAEPNQPQVYDSKLIELTNHRQIPWPEIHTQYNYEDL